MHIIVKNKDGKFETHATDSNGKATGKALGTFDTKAEAQDQIDAIDSKMEKKSIEDMGDDAPDAPVEEVLVSDESTPAGITVPVNFRFNFDEEQETTLIERIVDRIGKLFSGPEMRKKGKALKKKYSSTEERALDISQIWSQVDDYLWENSPDGWPYIVNFYANDDGSFYCVAALKGKLYKYGVTVANGEVIVSAGVEVEIEHVPVAGADTGTTVDQTADPAYTDNQIYNSYKPREITRIFRQKDGTYRRIDIACTSVLNRVGEIDSRALFDSFVAHAKDTGEYPYYTIYHQGETLRTGQADFLMRSGDIYITSGVYDKSKLAAIEIRARRNNPTYYGISIGYAPTKDADIIEVAKDIFVRSYSAGVNREISTLPESEAAAWFTSSILMEVNRMAKMHPKAKSSLRKMMDDAEIDDDELFESLTGDIDTTQRNIKDDKLVTRKGKTRAEVDEAKESDEDYEEFEATADDEDEVDDEVDTETDDEVEADDAETETDDTSRSTDDEDEMVFDDDAITGIAEAVVVAIAGNEELTRSLAEAIAGVSRSTDDEDSVRARLDALEEDDEERFTRFIEDLPETLHTTRKRKSGRAPGRGQNDNHAFTSSDIAGEALADAPY